MPAAKKTNKKSTSAKPMPSLVFNEMVFKKNPSDKKKEPHNTDHLEEDEEPTSPTSASKALAALIARERGRQVLRRWLWVAVSSFAALMLIIWLWSFKEQYTDFGWSTDHTAALEKSRARFDTLWQQTKNDAENARAVKAELQAALLRISTSSTTATSSLISTSTDMTAHSTPSSTPIASSSKKTK